MHERVDFVATYDQLYQSGYLDGSWGDEKKERLHRLLSSLPLPQTGIALDYGCGNGEITKVLRHALPRGWRVYGVEISREAVRDAKEYCEGCEFYVAGELPRDLDGFNLIFSHHVLEHVSSVEDVLANLSGLSARNAAMLHILPCGNEGSFEHRICTMVRSGVDERQGNKFFFEDPTHLRRMTTDDLLRTAKPHGFELVKEFYGNQYYGALEWITRSPPGLIVDLTSSHRGVDSAAKKRLQQLRAQLMFLWIFRISSVFCELRWSRKRKSWYDYPLLALGALLYPLSKPFDLWIKRKSAAEWKLRSAERNGSEMYLYFERS